MNLFSPEKMDSTSPSLASLISCSRLVPGFFAGAGGASSRFLAQGVSEEDNGPEPIVLMLAFYFFLKHV